MIEEQHIFKTEDYFLTKYNSELSGLIVKLTNLLNSIESESKRTFEPPSENSLINDSNWLKNDFSDDFYQKYLPLIANNQEIKIRQQKIGKIEVLAYEGGGEGEGEYVHRVYHFVNWDLYLSFTGTYYSFGDGTNFHTCREVRPRIIQAYAWDDVNENRQN